MATEFEGTWEEVSAHADELAGCRVRVTVLEKAREESLTPDQSNGAAGGWTDEEIKRFGIVPSRRGGAPIKDWNAFLESLPKFTHEEADALREAIEENRAMRRALAEEMD